MGKAINLTGQIFGRLTVIKKGNPYISPKGSKKSRWVCKCECECNNTVEAMTADLTSGNTKSCGCLRKERRLEASTTHGHSKVGNITKEYRAWVSMKTRCNNPNINTAKHYSGRGITVCKEWLNSYEQFLNDMGVAPGKDYSIDRIDNNLCYSKDNCRWVKDETGIQLINRRISSRNTSGVTGVHWDKNTNKWRAGIKVHKKYIYLGSFDNKEDAITARKEAEEKYHNIDNLLKLN